MKVGVIAYIFPLLYTEHHLSFGPATPRAHSPHWPDNLNTVHHHLTFEEDDDSSIDSNQLHDCHLTSADKEEEEDDEEHFPTAPLNDDVWMEEPVPDRHLCIHEHSQHDLCPYPCPYSLDQLHLTTDYAPQYMDLSQWHFWLPRCNDNCQWQRYS